MIQQIGLLRKVPSPTSARHIWTSESPIWNSFKKYIYCLHQHVPLTPISMYHSLLSQISPSLPSAVLLTPTRHGPLASMSIYLSPIPSAICRLTSPETKYPVHDKFLQKLSLRQCVCECMHMHFSGALYNVFRILHKYLSHPRQNIRCSVPCL